MGWLITLVDMTEIRRALQQRDQALHFISHDIRAPNASILTLLEMQRNSMEPLQADELLKRIEKYAQASLSMAESFVRLRPRAAVEAPAKAPRKTNHSKAPKALCLAWMPFLLRAWEVPSVCSST